MPMNTLEPRAASSSPCHAHSQALPFRSQQLQRRTFGGALNLHSRLYRPRHKGSTVSCKAGKQWDTGCKLVGCGSSVPEAVLSNKDLEQLVETNDEWIATRTGIRNRHILGKHESLSDHAAKASQQALDMAGIAAEDIDLIILATSSPDDLFGSACRVGQASCCLVVPSVVSLCYNGIQVISLCRCKLSLGPKMPQLMTSQQHAAALSLHSYLQQPISGQACTET